MADNYLKTMLRGALQELNNFIENYNRRSVEDGGIRIGKQTIKIAGQTALFLADLPFPITATVDVDIVVNLPHAVQVKLSELLGNSGMTLDPDGRLIWMPENTRYHLFFDAPWVQVLFADPEDVMLSKYKFNRADDRKVIQTYLQYYPGFQEVITRSKIKRK
jgi:hypothetical protein